MYVDGFSEILRNILACRGIEARCVTAPYHAFNQVKINGIWYNVDLTWDKGRLKQNEYPENCLLGDKNFIEDIYHKADANQKIEKCNNNYDEKKLREIYNKTIQRYNSGQKKENMLINEYKETDVYLSKIGEVFRSFKNILVELVKNRSANGR